MNNKFLEVSEKDLAYYDVGVFCTEIMSKNLCIHDPSKVVNISKQAALRPTKGQVWI